MPEKSKKEFIRRSLVLIVGVSAVLVVAFLSWAGVNLPLNIRFPVPSLDGRYFAYFDLEPSESPASQTRFDLVVSTTDGQLAAEFPHAPGPILWSVAGHIAVVDTKYNLTTVIPDVGGQFFILEALPVEAASVPVWSRDGTKLAYLRPNGHGEDLAVYNVQEPQSTTVPFPAGFHLNQAWLLAWSPLGDELYFLNGESDGVVLERVQIQTGELQALARGGKAWGPPPLRTPELSPDGTRIYLPAPIEAVVQAQTGETIWKLPDFATALWSPWSEEGVLYYHRRALWDQVFAHDFGTQADRTLFSGFPTDGIFSANGQSYFFRKREPPASGNFLAPIRAWLKPDWGWRQVNVRTSKAESFGRFSLRPWAETQDGLMVAREDDHKYARVGLYNPASREFSPFVIPTARDDRLRELKTHAASLLAIGLYGLLGFLVLLRPSAASSARSLAVLSFLLMLNFSAFDAITSWRALPVAWPALPQSVEILEIRGWLAPFDFVWLPLESVLLPLSLVTASLVPLTLVGFAKVFPEGDPFLSNRSGLRRAAYAIAALPLMGTVAALIEARSLESVWPLILIISLIGTALAMGVVLTGLFFSYRHPSVPRARDRIRWLALAVSVPPVGVAVWMLLSFVARWFGGWIGVFRYEFFDVNLPPVLLAWLCLFALVGAAYGLLARKPLDTQLVVRGAARYSVMAGLAAAVFLLFAAGLVKLTGSSVRNPSNLVIAASTLLTVGTLAFIRHRVEALVDRMFARSSYEIQGALENLAAELPRILDLHTLPTLLEESLRQTLKCGRVYLFILDRKLHRLRPQRGREALPREVADLEFDPAEPLCRYLVDLPAQAGRKPPLEVEVSPYDPKLVPILRSAADRLARARAELVFGLERRGELLGLLVVGPKESGDFFNAEEISLLSAVARQITVAIENSGLLEEVARDREARKELEAASEVETLLFPASLPHSKTCQIAGRSVPARSIGGDYYDFLELGENKIGLSIGDVSGKGISASRLMASVQGLLRDQAPAAGTPAELARRINRQLYSSSRGAKHCAFFYGVFDETTKQLEFVNAGHSPPLLINSQARKFLESTGVPLGLFPEVTHEVKSEALPPETLLVLYSDGITEARDEAGNSYGSDRLVDLVSREHRKPPEELVDRILEDVREFSGDIAADDDQTLVILKVNPL